MLSQILGFAAFLFLGIGFGAMLPKNLTVMAACFVLALTYAGIKIFVVDRKE